MHTKLSLPSFCIASFEVWIPTSFGLTVSDETTLRNCGTNDLMESGNCFSDYLAASFSQVDEDDYYKLKFANLWSGEELDSFRMVVMLKGSAYETNIDVT